MKLHRLLILSGLLTGAAPGVSYAECATACTLPDVCRYDSTQNPKNFCGLPSARVVAGVRSPTGSVTAKQGTGNVTGKGPVPGNDTARSAGPTVGPRAPVAHKESIEVASVKAHRERAAKATDAPKQ